MPNQLDDQAILDELAQVAEENLVRHIAAGDIWQPHEMVPWDDGRNFAHLGGVDWSPEQSTLSEVGKLALTVNVLVADNLPSYHRDLAWHLRNGAWWQWVGRWTAEEYRHAILIRDFLVLTRAVDPVQLERIRMDHMTSGYAVPKMGLLDVLVHSALQERAAAIRHRNTAKQVDEPVVVAMSERIAHDDELQAVFFGNIVAAALDVAPDQTVRAIVDRIREFAVPHVDLGDGRDSTAELAAAGIYDPANEYELVFRPLLEQWKIFEREDFGEEGIQARKELAALG